ncbi:hypothetical protein CEXT_366151, partial [Caerostris extrusa]
KFSLTLARVHYDVNS